MVYSNVICRSTSALHEKLMDRSLLMKHHKVFELVTNIASLRAFMQWHVFAVWDFMTLVKRLQHEYTTVRLPWCPPKRPQAARLINEIVLGEESDLTPQGNHCSHFELYMAAMEDVGSSTSRVRQFVHFMDEGMPLEDVMRATELPHPVCEFVKSTIDVALYGTTEEVLGSFLYGREDAIPEMFQDLLTSWKLNPGDAPIFTFYLQRHIQLDANSHAPAIRKIVEEQIGGEERLLERFYNSALDAVERRIQLWDSLAEKLSLPAEVCNRH